MPSQCDADGNTNIHGLPIEGMRTTKMQPCHQSAMRAARGVRFA
jgi:hypothetical protein